MSTVARLDQLSGLHQAKRITLGLVRRDSAVQAVLYAGPDGSGKNALADALAKSWLCTVPTSDGACDECASCQAYERARHADLLVVEPQPPSNLIRLAAIVGGDDALSVQEFLRTAPLMGRNKVVLIRYADRMNGDAANALLKTLEEPPPHARIILTTSAATALPTTILSRCLSCFCDLPGDAELRALAPEATDVELALAMGVPGRLAAITSDGHSAELLEFAQAVNAVRPRDALALTERFRELADRYENKHGGGARRAQAELLAELAICLRTIQPGAAVRAVVEAHRRVVGNGNLTFVLDGLFTDLAAKTS